MEVKSMVQTAQAQVGTEEREELPAPRLSWSQIEDYLGSLERRGCAPETVKSYRRNLLRFYRSLPPDKTLDREAVASWRDDMLARGYMPRTVNHRLTTVNGLLGYLDLREFQLPFQIKMGEDDVQPELTRNEYLRLLSAARALDKERTYLLVKVFATSGIAVQELPRLTVEAVEKNRVVAMSGGVPRAIKLPGCLRAELLDYARREGISSGPLFAARTGKALNRTRVTGCIQALSRDARVAPEKCNPRCLHRLYLSTIAGLTANVQILVEQSHELLLEKEQLVIGWET